MRLDFTRRCLIWTDKTKGELFFFLLKHIFFCFTQTQLEGLRKTSTWPLCVESVKLVRGHRTMNSENLGHFKHKICDVWWKSGAIIGVKLKDAVKHWIFLTFSKWNYATAIYFKVCLVLNTFYPGLRINAKGAVTLDDQRTSSCTTLVIIDISEATSVNIFPLLVIM